MHILVASMAGNAYLKCRCSNYFPGRSTLITCRELSGGLQGCRKMQNSDLFSGEC